MQQTDNKKHDQTFKQLTTYQNIALNRIPPKSRSIEPSRKYNIFMYKRSPRNHPLTSRNTRQHTFIDTIP